MTTYRAPNIDAFAWQSPVKDKDLTAPPGSPAKGDRYIIGSVATGAWATHDGQITYYDGASWVFLTMFEGVACWVEDENKVYEHNGTSWAMHDHSGVYAPVNQKLDDFGAPDDNADLNVSINAHGLMSKLPNEAMKIYTGDGSWAEFAASAGLIHVYSNAGATTRSSNDTQKSTTSSSYAKLKETKMGEPVKGVRIKFTLRTSNINYEAYGRIYRNGVAVGTERSTTSTGGEEFYEDFDAAWTTNDLIQVYAYRTGTATAYVLDFRFCYDRAIRSMGTWNLVAGLVTTEQTAYVMTNQDP